MHLIANNTNDLSPVAYKTLEENGIEQDSRNGPVLRIPEPVTITLLRPWERVNFCPVRDANPFFHLIESMFMLAGENYAPAMAHFAKNMANYSDDGFRFNAFYGTRARVDFGDQLQRCVELLIEDPTSRRAVVTLADPRDLWKTTKDQACNVFLQFEILHGHVVMNSFNRSNDAIWGSVSGANIVHLSFFHEYVSEAFGYPMGCWHHTSSNFHVYTENLKWISLLNEQRHRPDYPLYQRLFKIGTKCVFDKDVVRFCKAVSGAYECTDTGLNPEEFDSPFIRGVAVPTYNLWQFRKSGASRYHLESASNEIVAEDWRTACINWIQRRFK